MTGHWQKLVKFTIIVGVCVLIADQISAYALEEGPAEAPAGEASRSPQSVKASRHHRTALPSREPNQSPESSQESQDSSKFFAYVTGGLTFGSRTNYVLNYMGSNASSTISADDVTGIFGLEFHYKLTSSFQLGTAFEYTSFARPNQTNDSEYGFYLLPRFQRQKGFAIIWVGAGIGFIHTTFGNTNGTVGQFSVVDNSVASFAISPRIGAEFEFLDNFFVGPQLAYTTTFGSYKGYFGTSGIGVPFTQSFTRYWFSASVRAGVNF